MAAGTVSSVTSVAKASNDVISSLKLESDEIKEQDMALLEQVYQQTTNYFEYGCGISTNMAAAMGVKCITSVDAVLASLEQVEV